MTSFQKTIKYCAIVFAVFLTLGIFLTLLRVLVRISGDGISSEMYEYNISEDITEIKIELSAADFKIALSEEFKVESNINGLTVKNNNGLLEIKEKDLSWNIGDEDARFILYMPKSAAFKTIDINAGAGTVNIEQLNADKLNLKLGAGEFKISSITVNECADISGGAGKLEINSGTIKNLNLNMDVGSLILKSAVKGNSNLNMGIGRADIYLTGGKADYMLTLKKGVGKILVNGTETNGTYSNGENVINISGGMGDISVDFAEEQ